jgi:hypothetical protein
VLVSASQCAVITTRCNQPRSTVLTLHTPPSPPLYPLHLPPLSTPCTFSPSQIIDKLPKLKVILSGLFAGISACGYIMLLMGMVFYIYACLGISFFRANDPWHWFRLNISFETLFRSSTLEDWAYPFYTAYYGCRYIPYTLYTIHYTLYTIHYTPHTTLHHTLLHTTHYFTPHTTTPPTTTHHPLTLLLHPALLHRLLRLHSTPPTTAAFYTAYHGCILHRLPRLHSTPPTTAAVYTPSVFTSPCLPRCCRTQAMSTGRVSCTGKGSASR